MNYNLIPEELKNANRWVCHRFESTGDKRPLMPSGKPASHSDPKTWSSFDNCVASIDKHDGLGFVLGDGFVGFDFDHIISLEDNKWHGISESLLETLANARAYIEKSVSGTGIHAILKIDEPGENFENLMNQLSNSEGGVKKKFDSGEGIEFYHNHRYFTVSFDRVDLLPWDPCFEAEEEHLFATEKTLEKMTVLFPPKVQMQPQVTKESLSLSDSEILRKAERASNGAKFSELYNGEINGYNSHSEADIALLNMLAFWTGKDAEQMERIFRSSGLHREEGKGPNYLEDSIKDAISTTYNVYDGNGKAKAKAKNKKSSDEASGGSTTAQTALEMAQRNLAAEKGVPLGTPQFDVNELDGDDVSDRKANHIADEVMQAISESDPNELRVFVKDGFFGSVRETTREKRIDPDTKVDVTDTVFNEFTKDSLKAKLNRIGDFYKWKVTKKETTRKPLMEAPTPVANDILNGQEWDLIPRLNQIVNHPYLTRSWNLVHNHGYDAESQIYLNKERPVNLIEMSVQEAVDILDDWTEDFPFKDYSDKVNAFALLFTLFIRTALPEGALPPLFIITANTQGAGKSLLSQVLSAIVIGEAPGSTQLSSDEEELRKHIGSELLIGTEVIVFDNLEEQKKVASSSLATAISETKVRFRVLGKSEMKKAENVATYIFTGNNVTAHADLVDRGVFIRLQTQTRAADRSFSREDLLADTIKNRDKLFSAVYAIVKAWIDKGCEMGSKTHRFRNWAKTIDGIFQLINEECEDDVFDLFLENEIETKKEADSEFDAMCSFRDLVMYGCEDRGWNGFGEEPWKVKDVQHIASFKQNDDEQSENLLAPFFKGSREYWEANRNAALGTFIRSRVGKVYGNGKEDYELVDAGKRNGVRTYAFKRVQ